MNNSISVIFESGFLYGALLAFILFFWASYSKSNSVVSENQYLFADHKTSLFPLVATLVMTEFNPSTLLGFSGVAYYVGYWALLLPLVFLVGLLFYTVTVSQKWKNLGAKSVADLFTWQYGKTLGKTTSFLLIIAMWGFSATYIKSLLLFFSFLSPQISPFLWGSFLTLVILLWNLRGGLISIIRLDTLSFLFCLFVLPTFVYLASRDLGASMSELTLPNNAKEILPISVISSYICITMMTYIASPWYGQKIFSAKDSKTAFSAVGLASLFVFFLYSLPILAVAFLREKQIQIPQGEGGIPYLLENHIPGFPRGIFLMVFFSIGATTLSGVWSAQTSMVVRDFLSQESLGIKRGVYITVAFAIATLLGGIFLVDSILSKLILANIPIFSLSFALLGAFYAKKFVTRAGAWASILLGNLWGIVCYTTIGESGGYTIYWAFGGIPIVFVSGMVVSWFTRAKPTH